MAVIRHPSSAGEALRLISPSREIGLPWETDALAVKLEGMTAPDHIFWQIAIGVTPSDADGPFTSRR
jgi:hypothetical protein